MILLAALAFAADPAVVVLPASGGPDEGTIARALEAADLDEARSVDAGRFAAGVAHTPLGEGTGSDCDGPLAAKAWRAGLAAAHDRFDQLDAAGALTRLLDLDVELECLTTPITAADLLDLHLLRAETHLVLAEAARRDDAQAEFHAQEAAAALDRAAAMHARPAEEPSPDLAAAFAEAEARRAALTPPRVAVVGLRNGEEAWVDGHPLRDVAGDVAVGDTLVQRVADGRVTGARRVQLRAGEGAVVDFTRDDTPLGDVIAALVRRAPSPHEEALLVALAGVRNPDAEVVYVGWAEGSGAVWAVVGDGLARLAVPAVPRSVARPDDPPIRRPPPPPEDAERPAKGPRHEVRTWTGTAAVWFGGGWQSEDADGRLGAGLAGRVALTPRWALAWAATPLATAASIDPAGDGVEAELPLRVGARWGPHGPDWAGEVGGDLGVRWAPATATPLRPLLSGCGGVGRAVGPAGGFRAELCVDTDFAGVGLVAGVGVESRI